VQHEISRMLLFVVLCVCWRLVQDQVVRGSHAV
jgi:hypothetical protein